MYTRPHITQVYTRASKLTPAIWLEPPLNYRLHGGEEAAASTAAAVYRVVRNYCERRSTKEQLCCKVKAWLMDSSCETRYRKELSATCLHRILFNCVLVCIEGGIRVIWTHAPRGHTASTDLWRHQDGDDRSAVLWCNRRERNAKIQEAGWIKTNKTSSAGYGMSVKYDCRPVSIYRRLALLRLRN